MNNIFDAPPEGALQPNTLRPIKIEYKSGKFPFAVADKVTVEELTQDGTVGFSYWDAEANQRRALQKFTFVLLEVYAGVDGFDGTHSYRSNRVKDTRRDPLSVYCDGDRSPIARGLYQQIKPTLPDGAKYAKFMWAYCLELEKLVEIKLTAASERGLQRAVGAATSTKWEKVFTLSLADNDHLFGFSLTGFAAVTKEGDPYKGKVDLYFEPTFHCGIVNPTKSPDLHAKCVSLQQEVRETHEAYRAKHAKQAEEVSAEAANRDGRWTDRWRSEAEPAAQAPVNTNVKPSPNASEFPAFPENTPPVRPDDDLPF